MVTNSSQKIQPDLHGVLVVNKPAGITSHDVIYRLRKITGMQRIGHTGTLDPFATGVLLIAIGKATRLVEYAHGFSKQYVAEATLGATSTTDDLTGEITRAKEYEPPSKEKIEEVLSSFIGTIDQIPPMYSAIKVRGTKLYKYARSGTTIERAARRVTITNIELIDYTFPFITLSITCESGTYIRSLIRDIGDILLNKAYVSKLHRTSIGPFSDKKSVELEGLTIKEIMASLRPLDVLVSLLPSETISTQENIDIVQGKPILRATNHSLNTPFRLYSGRGEFIGIGTSTGTEIKPVKILV